MRVLVLQRERAAIQQRFKKDVNLKKPYSYGAYNKVRGDKQAIRITEGCVWNCPWCYEPTEIKVFGIPEIVRNDVLIYDMNLLCKPQALQIIEDLGKIRVNSKVVRYQLVCGIDYRFLTQEIADALYKNRFKRIRLAWDGSYKEQRKIKRAINMLLNGGYSPRDIMVFFLCNHKQISFKENCISLTSARYGALKFVTATLTVK